jgi:hypothetical protein
MEVCLYALDRKVVAGTALRASITRFSPQRVVVPTAHSMNRWEEVKIQILDDKLAPIAGESYAKVISVKHMEGSYECLMRFTSVPPEVLALLQRE